LATLTVATTATIARPDRAPISEAIDRAVGTISIATTGVRWRAAAPQPACQSTNPAAKHV
jgi:hypothetical protein